MIGLLLGAAAYLVPTPTLRASSPPRVATSPEMVVLKGISPLLSPELLSVLRSAGHGDVRARLLLMLHARC